MSYTFNNRWDRIMVIFITALLAVPAPKSVVAVSMRLSLCFCLVLTDFAWIICVYWQLRRPGCCLSSSGVIQNPWCRLHWQRSRAAGCSTMRPSAGSEWLGCSPAFAAVEKNESVASTRGAMPLFALGFCTFPNSRSYHESLGLNF